MMNTVKYFLLIPCVSLLMSCTKETVVMYSQEELHDKIDSLVQVYGQTVRPEYQNNYELRRPIEVRQRVQRIIEDRQSGRDKEIKNQFTDTVRLREDL